MGPAPSGLLSQLTKNVSETALDAEMTEHLGNDKHDIAGAAVATRVMAFDPRQCCPRSARSRSRFSRHRSRPGVWNGDSETHFPTS